MESERRHDVSLRGGAAVTDTEKQAYFYCMKHKAVEGEEGCRAADRLGPYETAEDAEHALQIAQERTEAWDDDPRWNDDLDD